MSSITGKFRQPLLTGSLLFSDCDLEVIFLPGLLVPASTCSGSLGLSLRNYCLRQRLFIYLISIALTNIRVKTVLSDISSVNFPESQMKQNSYQNQYFFLSRMLPAASAADTKIPTARIRILTGMV